MQRAPFLSSRPFDWSHDGRWIAYLASGAAGMFCGTCLHDNTLAAALLKAGEDVLLIPTYTPLRTDDGRLITVDRGYVSTPSGSEVPGPLGWIVLEVSE